MKKKIRAGVIGLGVGAHHSKILSLHSKTDLVWLCDYDIKRLQDIGSKFARVKITQNSNDIFLDPNIDLICIASYDEFHFEQVLMALKNNKHIYVEKPICLSEVELKKIRKIFKKYPNLHLSSNMVLRTCPLFKKVKKSIKLNKLGKIYHLEADYLWGRKQKLISGWRTKTNKYSIIYGAAVHMVDLIIWLIEKKPVKVQAFGNRISTLGSKQKNNDFAVLILEFDDKTTVKISAHGGCVHPHFHSLKVFGTNSSFIHDSTGTAWINSSNPNLKLKKENAEYPAKSKRDATLNSFLDYLVKGKKKPIVWQEDVFDVMSICLAAEKSVKKGEIINIQYI